MQKLFSVSTGCRLAIDIPLRKFLTGLVIPRLSGESKRILPWINVHKGYAELSYPYTYIQDKYPNKFYLDLEPAFYPVIEAHYKITGDLYTTLLQAIALGKLTDTYGEPSQS